MSFNPIPLHALSSFCFCFHIAYDLFDFFMFSPSFSLHQDFCFPLLHYFGTVTYPFVPSSGLLISFLVTLQEILCVECLPFSIQKFSRQIYASFVQELERSVNKDEYIDHQNVYKFPLRPKGRLTVTFYCKLEDFLSRGF